MNNEFYRMQQLAGIKHTPLLNESSVGGWDPWNQKIKDAEKELLIAKEFGDAAEVKKAEKDLAYIKRAAEVRRRIWDQLGKLSGIKQIKLKRKLLKKLAKIAGSEKPQSIPSPKKPRVRVRKKIVYRYREPEPEPKPFDITPFLYPGFTAYVIKQLAKMAKRKKWF